MIGHRGQRSALGQNATRGKTLFFGFGGYEPHVHAISQALSQIQCAHVPLAPQLHKKLAVNVAAVCDESTAAESPLEIEVIRVHER